MPNRHNKTAEEWVKAFQRGEEKAFGFFFRQYYAALCFFANRYVKDMPAAEDIAEESFIKLWERRANFDNDTSIKSFLYTTARNTSLNRVRQQKRENQRIKEVAWLAEENEGHAMQHIIEAELYREILMSLETLPPRCMQIFKMLYFEGKDYQQIAQELNLSISTIRNQKARALMLIRERVALGIAVILFLQVI